MAWGGAGCQGLAGAGWLAGLGYAGAGWLAWAWLVLDGWCRWLVQVLVQVLAWYGMAEK